MIKLPDAPFSLKSLLQPVPSGRPVPSALEEVGAQRERAGQDLTDIAALRKTEEFSRFFLRRVRQKRDASIHALIYETCDPLTREGIRQKVIALEETLTLLEDDDRACRKLLG